LLTSLNLQRAHAAFRNLGTAISPKSGIIMPKAHIAILIDAENVGARYWPEIEARAVALGSVNSCKVFGDFTEDRLGKWLDVSRQHGLQAILQVSGGKNASDIAIVIDAMDTLHGGRVQAVILVTSDQDFAPLAFRLRGAGIKVYGLGRDDTPDTLRLACTEFSVLGEVPAQKIQALRSA
jgi:hypothetical protein